MPAGFGYGAQPERISLQDRVSEAIRSVGGLRNLVRATGMPFTTLQGIASGRTRNPRPATIARLEAGLLNLPTFRTIRERTIADDRPLWGDDDLASARPPRGSTAFKLVFWSDETQSRAATSDWFTTDTFSVLDAVRSIGAQSSIIRRVIWDRG